MTTNDITSVAPVVRKAADGSVIPAVKAVQVHKAFGPLHVLKGIDLTVMPGTVTVILGPSGSGKSTFLRLINQLETLTGGSIEVDGELIGYKHVTKNGQDMLQTLDDKEIAAQRSRLGMVFQRFNLFPHMTALENVMEAPIHVCSTSPRKPPVTWPWPSFSASVWAIARTITPPSCRVVSSSAWPLPVLWP